jgi:hypothetical protein
MNCLIDDNGISRMPCDGRLGMLGVGADGTEGDITAFAGDQVARLGRDQEGERCSLLWYCTLHKEPG